MKDFGALVEARGRPQPQRAGALARGELTGTPELLFVLGTMNLARFAAARGS
jgi:hypothetical protein